MTEAGWTRERKLVEELLTFIEAVSGRKLRFSSIANFKTGETEDPQDRTAAWLKRHLDDTYAQGRAVRIAKARDKWLLGGGYDNMSPDFQAGYHQACHHILAALTKGRA